MLTVTIYIFFVVARFGCGVYVYQTNTDKQTKTQSMKGITSFLMEHRNKMARNNRSSHTPPQLSLNLILSRWSKFRVLGQFHVRNWRPFHFHCPLAKTIKANIVCQGYENMRTVLSVSVRLYAYSIFGLVIPPAVHVSDYPTRPNRLPWQSPEPNPDRHSPKVINNPTAYYTVLPTEQRSNLRRGV